MKIKRISISQLYTVVLPNARLLIIAGGFIYIALLYVFFVSLLLQRDNFITCGFFSNQLFFAFTLCGIAAVLSLLSRTQYPRLGTCMLFFFLINAFALPIGSKYFKDTVYPSEKLLLEQTKGLYVSKVETSEPLVALTFDDGPVPGKTEGILDVLKSENVHATFFVIGNKLPHNEAIVRRAYEEGNEIGNHTFSHYIAKCSLPQKVDQEYMETSRLIQQITGEAPKYCRPPTGMTNAFYIRRMHHKYGMKPVYWTNSSGDWRNSDDDACFRTVTDGLPYGGAIFLHHDKSSSPALIKRIIQELKKRGYRFVTISEMLENQVQ